MHSASQYGSVDQMSENLFGITQVNRMQEIARLENFDEIAKQLIEIAKHVLKKSSLRFVSFRRRLRFFNRLLSSCALNGEATGLTHGMKRLETFLDRLPGPATSQPQPIRHEDARQILKNDFQLGRRAFQAKTHFEMPFDVFYSGQCFQSVPYAHEDHVR